MRTCKHLFEVTLDRAIDAPSLAILEQAMTDGVTAQEVAGAVLQSAEYHVKLVGEYYLAYLRRPLDPVGAQNWVVNGIQAGKLSDFDVLAAVLGSEEYYHLATGGWTDHG